MQIFSVYLNFLTILTIFTVLTGIIVLINKLFLHKKRIAAKGEDCKDPIVIEYSKSFFPVLLIVLVLRSFFYEGYRIPSGSLEPTLLVGDIILVNKYTYGFRLPVGNGLIMSMNKPSVGDIVVFEWPPNRNIYMIKRVIGLPGDVVEYKNNKIWINGSEAKQEFVAHQLESGGHTVELLKEELAGVEHQMYVASGSASGELKVVVPKDHYFMLGDNRSFSADSRYWGFMPFDNIVGKATAIVVSWNTDFFNLRWNRTFNSLT